MEIKTALKVEKSEETRGFVNQYKKIFNHVPHCGKSNRQICIKPIDEKSSSHGNVTFWENATFKQFLSFIEASILLKPSQMYFNDCNLNKPT